MNIASVIKEFIVQELLMDGRSELSPEDSLIDSGILNSLSLLRLVGFIEDRIGVTVDDDELVPEHFQTIRDITSFLEGKLQANR